MLGLSGNNKSDSSRRRHILFVADRYWPFTSDATLRLQSQLRLWNQRGWQTTLITPRWHRTWASQIHVENTSVIRLDHPPTDSLRSGRYRRCVSQWLSKNLISYDAIWCDDVQGKATESAAEAAKSTGKPWVARFELDTGERTNADGSSSRPSDIMLQLCAQASAVVVSTAAAHQCLIQHGMSGQKIVRQSDWRVASLDRSTSARTAARHALGAINAELALKPQEKLIVVPGELSEQWAISMVLDAVAPLLERHPNLHLWLHGEGSRRERYHEWLKERSLHRIVLMPGIFSCLEPLLQAADLCLFPAAGCGRYWLLPTCLVSEIPVLTPPFAGLEQHLSGGGSALTFQSACHQDLQSKIGDWMKNPTELLLATRKASGAIRRLEQTTSSATFPDDSSAHWEKGQGERVQRLWDRLLL